MNLGLRELDSKKKLKPIKVAGKDITTPVLLDASGKQAPPSSPPYVLNFEVYRQQNFGGLFT